MSLLLKEAVMTLFAWLLLVGLSVSTLGDGLTVPWPHAVSTPGDGLVDPWPHRAYTQDPADTFGPSGAAG